MYRNILSFSLFLGLSLFTVSCSSDISGDYSGSNTLADFEITLNEDSTWVKVSTSKNSLIGMGSKMTHYGTWRVNSEKSKLYLSFKNGKTNEYNIIDGWGGYSFYHYSPTSGTTERFR